MKIFLYLCALLLALGGVFSCRTARPDRAAGTALTQPYTPTSAAPDSLPKHLARIDSVVVTPHRSLVDKVLGRKAKPGIPVLPSRIGKKSTVSIYYGPATVTTNTAAKNATAGTGATGGGKAGAPVAGAGATATDNSKAGQRGGAAATAPNAQATATTVKPPTPWLKYGLWAAGALGIYWLLFGGGGAVLLALIRRNKSTDSQA